LKDDSDKLYSMEEYKMNEILNKKGLADLVAESEKR